MLTLSLGTTEEGGGCGDAPVTGPSAGHAGKGIQLNEVGLLEGGPWPFNDNVGLGNARAVSWEANSEKGSGSCWSRQVN